MSKCVFSGVCFWLEDSVHPIADPSAASTEAVLGTNPSVGESVVLLAPVTKPSGRLATLALTSSALALCFTGVA